MPNLRRPARRPTVALARRPIDRPGQWGRPAAPPDHAPSDAPGLRRCPASAGLAGSLRARTLRTDWTGLTLMVRCRIPTNAARLSSPAMPHFTRRHPREPPDRMATPGRNAICRDFCRNTIANVGWCNRHCGPGGMRMAPSGPWQVAPSQAVGCHHHRGRSCPKRARRIAIPAGRLSVRAVHLAWSAVIGRLTPAGARGDVDCPATIHC